jgi:deazaflavin-dependent oxidoreductase (nitroreductase family)
MPGDHFIAKLTNSMGARGLRWTGKLNVPLYRLSGGRLGATVGDGPVLLLTTTGNKSGERRTAPVLYLAHDEAMIVIDTNAGNEKLPAWSHNLKAKPEAEVEIGKRKLRVSARAAAGVEREELWRACNEQYAGFDDYIKWLDRTPSVWVLEPVRERAERPVAVAEDADSGTTREPPAAAADTAPADTI